MHTWFCNDVLECLLAAPGPPTLISVVNSGILKIQVTWTAPTQPNGIINGYQVSTTIDHANSLVVYIWYGEKVMQHKCMVHVKV